MDLNLAVVSVAVPVLGYIALERFVLRAWKQQREARYVQIFVILHLLFEFVSHCRRIEQKRKDNAQVLEQRRKEAEAAQALLAENISRKLESEEARDGLVIISALYGKLPPSDLESVRVLSPQGIKDLSNSIRAQFNFLKQVSLPVSHQKEFIDVTVPVQALVTGGQLHIPAGSSKSQLIGFYDPCFGERKELRVTYQFQGRLHQVTVSDRAPLAAPLRGNSWFDLAHFVGV